jgi:hypothetical protein
MTMAPFATSMALLSAGITLLPEVLRDRKKSYDNEAR